MNKNDLNKHSIISGKTKKYTPLNVVYFGDTFDKVYNNVVVISCFLNENGERRYNDIKFHESINITEISCIEKAHFSYIIQLSKEVSEEIITDIKNSDYFKQ